MWVFEEGIYVYRQYQRAFRFNEDEFYMNNNLEIFLRRLDENELEARTNTKRFIFGTEHPIYLNVLCIECDTSLQYIGDMIHCPTCNTVGNAHKLVDKKAKDKIWLRIK